MNNNATEILTLFATYGFRKASMGDIAKAAGLSRQSIYNQFGSKDAVLDWALTAFLSEVTDMTVRLLETSDEPADQVVARAFQAWTGDHVPLIRGTPHGAELLDKAIETATKSSPNYERDVADAVASFLWKRKVFSTKAAAEEATFVLSMASKGLLLKSDTSEAYASGMARVIKVLFD